MTDKQIMINDVDVSRCDFLAKEDDYCSYSGEYRAYKGQCGCSDEKMCKDHPNCFYKKALKQLKRKEQECEDLKKYKKVVDKLAGMQVILTNEEKMPMLYENAKDLKLKQLSKTLTEIKEIAKYDVYTTRSDLCLKLNRIKKKISECEVKNE